MLFKWEMADPERRRVTLVAGGASCGVRSMLTDSGLHADMAQVGSM